MATKIILFSMTFRRQHILIQVKIHKESQIKYNLEENNCEKYTDPYLSVARINKRGMQRLSSEHHF